MNVLQNPPTSLSRPHWQAGTLRYPFERDVICNKYIYTYTPINLSVLDNWEVIK